MRSSIYPSKVLHTRLSPKRHHFIYRTSYHLFDLSKLDELTGKCRLFRYNRFGLFSLHDTDYLEKRDGSIQKKLFTALEDRGFSTKGIVNTYLLTAPRFLNYAFNPVSFYFCMKEGHEQPEIVVVEINNTFNEKHIHILTAQSQDPERKTYKQDKSFHVSPFFDRSGEYVFSFKTPSDSFEARIDLTQEGRLVFHSKLWGKRRSFNDLELAKAAIKAPYEQSLTYARILWQAAILYYRKKLKVFSKPQPHSNETIRCEPDGIAQNLTTKILCGYLSRAKRSRLKLFFPDQRKFEFGESSSSPSAEIFVKSYDFFWKVCTQADVGFAASYIDGDWETPDLKRVLNFFIQNEEFLDDRKMAWSSIGRGLNRWRHWMRRNTLVGSVDNIRRHYDLSNDLFETFLDRHMQYSCGIYEEGDDLEAAQLNKMNLFVEKLDIQSSDHVLEIGCGWGGWAVHVAKQRACRVTGITISKEQLLRARQRAADEGVEHLVDFELVDYRNMRGQFDKVLSCEMIEAVGESQLTKYFSCIERLLRPQGIALIQAISLPNSRYRFSRKNADFIQQFVFPGSCCPSLEYMMKALSKGSTLDVHDLREIGSHYVKTLADWNARVQRNTQQIRSLGFDDRFLRLWHYYLTYCEVGFANKLTYNYQIVLGRSKRAE